MRNGAGCWPTMQHLCRLAKYGIDRKDNHNSLSRQWSNKRNHEIEKIKLKNVQTQRYNKKQHIF